MDLLRRVLLLVLATPFFTNSVVMHALAAEPAAIRSAEQHWLREQRWRRDSAGPVVSLGKQGQFDDTHIFAPLVTRVGDRFRLYYCGSTGRVAERVFHMGMAESSDGRSFEKRVAPVFSFPGGRRSILTPTFARDADGRTVREQGRWRLWFSSTDFTDKSGLHTLHQASSEDGLEWSTPSDPQLRNVYAPTILVEDGRYQMWYTDVARDPWIIRRAVSSDGRQWRVDAEPALVVDQKWERSRLFYPTVLKRDSLYVMWYGSYWSAMSSKTAIGVAVSRDGKKWTKSDRNPVLRPDPQRPWESHYTTSQSVLPLDDGSLRIWYASRKAPPFRNKYFALNTAIWKRP